MAASRPVTIETLVAASPEVAWHAYTTPEAITCWNFASPDWHCPSAEVELRAGGTYRARMAARDESMAFDFSGTYESVEPPHRLMLVLDDGRRVHTSFEADAEGTRVRTVFDADASHPEEAQRDGWQAILDNYRAYVDAGADHP